MTKKLLILVPMGLLSVLACSHSPSAPDSAGASGFTNRDASGAGGSLAAENESRYMPTAGTRGMVVADDRQAAEWGAEVLRKGGNAVDAAVATAFAMAVTRPHYASIGGGGFMVYCPVAKPCVALDYREAAPAAATRDMYIVKDTAGVSKARTDLSQDGALASGVPGVTAGLLTALEKYGTQKRAMLLSRPIELARQGVRMSTHTESAADDRWKVMNPEGKRIWGCAAPSGLAADGPRSPCPVGSLIRQPDLASVLTEISSKGIPGFYRGWVAKRISSGLRMAGGILSEADLAMYEPKWRTPVAGRYKGYEVVSMPPPSAGGAVMLQLLGFSERASAQGAYSRGWGAASTSHAIAHGMSLGFADRAKFFGDPDFVNVPLAEMISPAYLDSRWKTFDSARASPAEGAGPLALSFKEGNHTTHFSVIDRQGNAVAITTTVNDNFGSAFVPPGTGIVMNNEMDDFSVQPGTPNLFGLVGAEANAVAAHKRPLSSMSPTVVRDAAGMTRLVLGAAGGPKITTSVYQTILNRFEFGLSLPDAVAAPRIHQQWRPTDLMVERGLSRDTREQLERLGYKVSDKVSMAKVHALERFADGRTWGVPDPRGEGAAVAE